MAPLASDRTGKGVDRCLALLLGAAAVAIGLPLLRVGLDLGDEGWLVTTIERMAAGEWLYRDIYRSYGPGVYAPFVPLFRWTEAGLLTVRVASLVGVALLCAGTYALARPFAPRWAAFAAATLPMVLRPPVQKIFVPLSFLASLWLARRLLDRDVGPRGLVALGAAFGLVGLVRQEAGAYGILVGFVTLVLSMSSKTRRDSRALVRARSALRVAVLLGAGAVAVWLPFLIVWAEQAMLGDTLQQLVLQGARGNAAMSLPFPPLVQAITGPRRLATAAFYFPAASVAAGALMLLHAARRGDRSTETLVVTQWTLVALLSHSIFLSRTDLPHLSQALVAPLLLWACAAGRLVRAWRGLARAAGGGWIRLAGGVLLAGPVAILVVLGASNLAKSYALRREGIELDLPRAPVIVAASWAHQLRRIVAAIREDTRSGDPIFVAPYAPGLYFLAERRNPSRHDVIVPGFATPEIQEEVAAALERERVSLVVVDMVGFDRMRSRRLPTFAPRLWRYLTSAYVRDRTIGSFVLLRRRPLASHR